MATRRLPISMRHAYALAFDLALRRDALQSIVVPLLLQAPWVFALGLLPNPKGAEHPIALFFVWLAATLGNFAVWLVITAMLRFRARSVFNTPPGTAPAPVLECYDLGLRRVPWLLLTEIVRNLSILLAFFFFMVPAVLLGFRLSFATEAVVLAEPHMAGAFQRSFKLTEGRFERWLEMIVTSVVFALMLVIFGGFIAAVLSLAFPGPGLSTWFAFSQVPAIALMPVIQYAWTFFFLRLVEIEDGAAGTEAGPAYAAEEVPAPDVAPPAVAGEALATAAEEPAMEGGIAVAGPASATPIAVSPEPEAPPLAANPAPEPPPFAAGAQRPWTAPPPWQAPDRSQRIGDDGSEAV